MRHFILLKFPLQSLYLKLIKEEMHYDKNYYGFTGGS